MFAIMMAAIVGGPLTSALLWDHGAVVALAAAPFGGSLSGLMAAWLITVLRARSDEDTAARGVRPVPQSLPGGL
ncbi:hypothetical protein [Methylobacterium oxalidis]|uniref:hypothetical protein n=1 Tax=Methylobacterium oxalidis TaxID=944322 RepID=UPI0033154B7E